MLYRSGRAGRVRSAQRLVGAVYSTDSNDGYSGGRGVVVQSGLQITCLIASLSIKTDQHHPQLHIVLGNGLDGLCQRRHLARKRQPTDEHVGSRVHRFRVRTHFADHRHLLFSRIQFLRRFEPELLLRPNGRRALFPTRLYWDRWNERGYTGNFVLARIQLNPSQSAVPEPSTWAMMLIGFGAVGYGMRRRRRSAIGLPQRA